MSDHARLAPSNHRWPHCPGSVREEAQYPDISGAAAIDGTGSHLLLELCLNNNVPAASYVGQVIGANHHDSPNGWLVMEDRVTRVQQCLDYLTRRFNELSTQFPGAAIIIEAESHSDPGGAFGRTDWHGTCDITVTVMLDDRVVFIETIDYKDGREFVSVRRDDSEYHLNTQLTSYLFGKLRPHVASGENLVRPFHTNGIDGARMTIVQPKTNPSIRYEDCPVIDVINVAEKMGWAAAKTDDPNAPCISGSHCRWCKANPKRGGHCTMPAAKSIEVLDTMSNKELSFVNGGVNDAPSDVNLQVLLSNFSNIETIDNDKLSHLMSAKDGIVAIFDRVEQELTTRIENGQEIPGYKIAPGRGKNVWNDDEEAIAKALRGRRLKKEDIYETKLISPTAVMKLDQLTDAQKKKIEKDLVSYIAGKPTLKKVAHVPVDKEAKSLFADVESKQPLSFI